MTTLTNWYRVP